jgi:hypothetical protein
MAATANPPRPGTADPRQPAIGETVGYVPRTILVRRLYADRVIGVLEP